MRTDLTSRSMLTENGCLVGTRWRPVTKTQSRTFMKRLRADGYSRTPLQGGAFFDSRDRSWPPGTFHVGWPPRLFLDRSRPPAPPRPGVRGGHADRWYREDGGYGRHFGLDRWCTAHPARSGRSGVATSRGGRRTARPCQPVCQPVCQPHTHHPLPASHLFCPWLRGVSICSPACLSGVGEAHSGKDYCHE